MFNNTNYRRKGGKRAGARYGDTTFDATGPLPGVEEEFKAAPQAVGQASVETVRAAILQASLYGAVAFGVIALLATLPNRLQNQQYALIAVFATALAFTAFIAFNRRVSYALRASTFIGLLVILSVFTLLTDGLYGNGRIFLITIPIMAALLFGIRSSVVAVVLSLAFVAVIGALMSLGRLPAPSTPDPNSQVSLWLVAFATLILVVMTTTFSLNAMLRGLQRSIATEQRLRTELDTERAALEGRIQDRTNDLQRRLVQLRTASEISNTLTAVLDPQTLLQQVVDVVQQRFDLYYTGVFLLDERSENAVLRAGSGEAGQKMLSLGHYLPLNGTSMISWSINNRKARIALDVGEEAVRFSNPHLPLTRSELALPLLSGEDSLPIGAMTVQSARPQAFDEDDIIVLQSIANALTTALVNANLFQQVDRSLQEIRTLNRQYLQQAWERTVSQSIQDDRPLSAVAEDAILLNAFETSRQAALSAGAPTSQDAGASAAATPLSLEVPLVVREHRFGAIKVDAVINEAGKSTLSPEDRAFLDQIAQETAQALEKIRLLEETQARARREQSINTFMGSLSSSLDLDALLQSAARQFGLLPNIREVTVRLEVEKGTDRPEQPAPSQEARP